MRAFLLALGILAAVVVLGSSFAVDEGEVVSLVTEDDHGAHYETTLWIVDQDGALFLRASRPRVQWLVRLRTHPGVEIRRGERLLHFVAHPDERPEVRARVNAAMAAKYGTANRLLGHLFDLERAVPIRLEPGLPPSPVP